MARIWFRAGCWLTVFLMCLSAPSERATAQLTPKRTLAAGAPTGYCAALNAPVPTPPSSSQADDAETRRLIGAGQEASLQGDHAAARDAFAQAATRSPTNAVVAYYLGREHEFLMTSMEAVKEYCRYLRLSPAARDADEVRGRIVRLTPASQIAQVDEARANFSSGVALLERRQYIAADSMFGSIAAQLPNTPEIYYNRALSRAARGERGLATEDFDKYIELAGDPADRLAIRAAVARLQDRVFGSGQALGSGLLLPGMGQMQTGRPFAGVAVLGVVAGALVWGMSREQGFEIATFEDPFGNPYVDSLPTTTRPNFVIGAATAGLLWVGSAVEAMSYARRTRARAESIIQLNAPISEKTETYFAIGRGGIGAGLRIRLR